MALTSALELLVTVISQFMQCIVVNRMRLASNYCLLQYVRFLLGLEPDGIRFIPFCIISIPIYNTEELFIYISVFKKRKEKNYSRY